jgi:hypothetical protein
VLMFCCKGMIEGIMVILFFWLLVQVLFTKQLEGRGPRSSSRGNVCEYVCNFKVAHCTSGLGGSSIIPISCTKIFALLIQELVKTLCKNSLRYFFFPFLDFPPQSSSRSSSCRA